MLWNSMWIRSVRIFSYAGKLLVFPCSQTFVTDRHQLRIDRSLWAGRRTSYTLIRVHIWVEGGRICDSRIQYNYWPTDNGGPCWARTCCTWSSGGTGPAWTRCRWGSSGGALTRCRPGGSPRMSAPGLDRCTLSWRKTTAASERIHYTAPWMSCLNMTDFLQKWKGIWLDTLFC